MADWVSEIGFSGIQNQPKNGLKGKLNKAFSFFLPFLVPYLIIFQSLKAKKFGKNEEKSC